MKKIVIIGASYLQLPLIKKVKEMGYETHVFAWQEGAVGFEYIDKFYPISIREIEQIKKECEKIKPSAIVSIASDLANITVHEVARQLGLPCNSKHCIEISTNKYLMREAFEKADIPCPKFKLVDETQNLEELKNNLAMQFPIIVKPTDRSGSRAITKLKNSKGFVQAVENAISQSFEKKAIVEEFVEGDEFSMESISYKGKHTVLNITKKFTTGAPHFIETGHLEPAGFTGELKQKIETTICKALDALEIKMGASHAEFKVDRAGNVRIIEIGSRMGGDFIGAELVKLSTGHDFVQMVVETALGQPPTINERKDAIAGIKFIFNEKDINQIEKRKKKFPQSFVQGETFYDEIKNKVVDSGTRHGYAIFMFDSFDEAKKFLG